MRRSNILETNVLGADAVPQENKMDESESIGNNDEPSGINDTEYITQIEYHDIEEMQRSSKLVNDLDALANSDKRSNLARLPNVESNCMGDRKDKTDNIDDLDVVENLGQQSLEPAYKDEADERTIQVEGNNSKRMDAKTEQTTQNESVLAVENKCHDDSKDMEDGFIKFLKMCAGGRAKFIDQDDEMYGFDEDLKITSVRQSRGKRPLLKRSSKRCLSPTPISIYHKEISSKKFEFRTTPQQTKIITEKLAQQESSLFSEIVDENQYNFSYPQRGHMVLIVNDRFLRQAQREGAIWDLRKMKQIAFKFGFRIYNSHQCRNLTKQETISILREAQSLDHSDSDCFMFVISTHGLEVKNPRAKGKLDHVVVCSDDQFIFTSSILEMFNDKNCPTLKNKPKLFFIQACRGEKYDAGSEVLVLKSKNEDLADKVGPTKDRFGRPKLRSIDVTDTKPSGDSWETSRSATATAQLSKPVGSLTGNNRVPYEGDPRVEKGDLNLNSAKEGSTYAYTTAAQNQRYETASQLLGERSTHENVTQQPYPINDTPSLQCDSDFLVMYAIPPGYFAWRNTVDGSWMIDYLHKTVMSYDMKKPKDFLRLLRKVTCLMSKRETNTPSDSRMHQMKAIPVIEHKLVKDIIFKQKAVMSAWIRKDIYLRFN